MRYLRTGGDTLFACVSLSPLPVTTANLEEEEKGKKRGGEKKGGGGGGCCRVNFCFSAYFCLCVFLL